MWCKSCQRKWKKELFARQLKPRKEQMYHSEILEGTRSPTFQACLGKPKVICRRGTLTQFHQRGTYKDKQYIQRTQEFSRMMLSRHRRIIPLVTRSSKRSTRRCTYRFLIASKQTIVSRNAFPEQPERYTTLYHLRYLRRWWPKGLTFRQGEN